MKKEVWARAAPLKTKRMLNRPKTDIRLEKALQGEYASAASVLIPAFNEAKTIALVLERVLDLGPLVHEVIVVDDGSTDETVKIVEQTAVSEPKIRLLQQDRNRGKTAAIVKAIAAASGAVVVIQDADLEYDPAELPRLVEPILEGRADVVYGSRFSIPKSRRGYLWHYLANRGLTHISNILSGYRITDVETCYKAFRTDLVKPLPITSSRFGIEIEITAMLARTPARLIETPVSYSARSFCEGKKIRFVDGVWAIYYLGYYNLIAPWRRASRAYLRRAREILAQSAASRSD
jgi:glycosyltransferase involved in cell wall biosynthesis